MKIYIEIWKAKETWTKLPIADRQNYLGQLQPAITQLLAAGVEVIAWGTNELSTYARAEYDYFAIWKFPDPTMISSFEQMVEGAGWYNYFDQVNMKGSAVSPEEVMGKMIKDEHEQ